MNKPNIVLNIIEKDENIEDIGNDNNDNQENINDNQEIHNDYEDTLTDKQKLKLQSWIDSEEDSDIELRRIRLEHDALFKQIDKRIEANKKKIEDKKNSMNMMTLMNRIQTGVKRHHKTLTNKNYYNTKANAAKKNNVIKPYSLKLF